MANCPVNSFASYQSFDAALDRAMREDNLAVLNHKRHRHEVREVGGGFAVQRYDMDNNIVIEMLKGE